MNTNIDISPYIHYNKKYAVLLCIHCKASIPPATVARHLREEHKYIPITTRDAIVEYASTLRLCGIGQVATPPEEEGPIQYLELIEKGYQCSIENCKLCLSTKLGIEKHCNKHGWTKGQENMWEIKPIQRFFDVSRSKYTLCQRGC